MRAREKRKKDKRMNRRHQSAIRCEVKGLTWGPNPKCGLEKAELQATLHRDPTPSSSRARGLCGPEQEGKGQIPRAKRGLQAAADSKGDS